MVIWLTDIEGLSPFLHDEPIYLLSLLINSLPAGSLSEKLTQRRRKQIGLAFIPSFTKKPAGIPFKFLQHMGMCVFHCSLEERCMQLSFKKAQKTPSVF